MRSVIETPGFIRDADRAGVSEEERSSIVNAIAANPMMGEVIVGTGGCRKVRFAAVVKASRAAAGASTTSVAAIGRSSCWCC